MPSQGLIASRWSHRVSESRPPHPRAFARAFPRDFLDARTAYLRARGLDPARVEPLLPSVSPKTGRAGYWDDSVLIRLNCEVERLAGVRFKLNDSRAAFAQMNSDRKRLH